MSLQKKDKTVLKKKQSTDLEPWVSVFWVLAIIAICGSWVYAYRSSSEVISFTVDRRERVTQNSSDFTQSYYFVWSSEGEVFQVNDDWIFFTWNSSDRYGQLKERTTVRAKVAGWRVPFFSWYRNIVEIE